MRYITLFGLLVFIMGGHSRNERNKTEDIGDMKPFRILRNHDFSFDSRVSDSDDSDSDSDSNSDSDYDRMESVALRNNKLARFYYHQHMPAPLNLDAHGDIASIVPGYLIKGTKWAQVSDLKDYDDYVDDDDALRKRNRRKRKSQRHRKIKKLEPLIFDNSSSMELDSEETTKDFDKAIKHIDCNMNKNRAKCDKEKRKKDKPKKKYSDSNSSESSHESLIDSDVADYIHHVEENYNYIMDDKSHKDDGHKDDGHKHDGHKDNTGHKKKIDNKGSSDSDFVDDADEIDENYSAPRVPDDYHKNKPNDKTPEPDIPDLATRWPDDLNPSGPPPPEPGPENGTPKPRKPQEKLQSGVMTNQWITQKLKQTIDKQKGDVIQTLNGVIGGNMKLKSRMCVLNRYHEYCIGEETLNDHKNNK